MQHYVLNIHGFPRPTLPNAVPPFTIKLPAAAKHYAYAADCLKYSQAYFVLLHVL